LVALVKSFAVLIDVNAGVKKVSTILMIATTTSISTRVKPRDREEPGSFSKPIVSPV